MRNHPFGWPIATVIAGRTSGTEHHGLVSDSPLDVVAWPVRTERLEIRPGTVDDVEPTWRYRRLPEVFHWITSAPATVEAYGARFVEPQYLTKTLVVEVDGDVVGDLMVAVGDAWGQAEVAEQARGTEAELGWALDPRHAGLGYATEAVRALIGCCFEELGLRRVTAQCFADNEASRRLMARVGLRPEALLVRDSLHRSGDWMDTAGYALLAEEWPTVRGRS